MRTILIWLIILAVGSPATAHEVREAATTTAKPVYVQRTGAPEIHGQLLRLGPDTMTILESGTPRDIPMSDVLRIDVSGDSVKNGAIIGAIVLGVWCAVICGLDIDNAGHVAAAAVANAGLGAIFGAGIDAMHVGRTTIYRTSPAASAGRPALGAALSFSF